MARQKKTFDEIVGDEKPQVSKKTNTTTQKTTVASKATKQDEDKETERLKE